MVARRISRHVVLQRHGDIDQLPRHGHSFEMVRYFRHFAGPPLATSSQRSYNAEPARDVSPATKVIDATPALIDAGFGLDRECCPL
jgi:hypothetical protein